MRLHSEFALLISMAPLRVRSWPKAALCYLFRQSALRGPFSIPRGPSMRITLTITQLWERVQNAEAAYAPASLHPLPDREANGVPWPGVQPWKLCRRNAARAGNRARLKLERTSRFCEQAALAGSPRADVPLRLIRIRTRSECKQCTHHVLRRAGPGWLRSTTRKMNVRHGRRSC